MSYVVYHDHKPAHSSEKQLDIRKCNEYSFCPRCEDWFKPAKDAETRKSAKNATVDTEEAE